MNRTSIRPLRLHALSAAALLACAGSTALAADAAAAPDASASQVQAPQLPAQRVRAQAIEETAAGPVEGYRAKRSATATKTDTPLEEIPQSITVISAEQIRDQNAQTMQEVLRYTAGVRSDMYGLDNRGDWFDLRGGSEGSTLLNGMRLPLTGWYGVVRNDPYAFERIEVLRGPASLMAGQNGPGGVVNLVSKRPQAQAAREISVQLGNNSHKQITADLTGPVNEDGSLLYRVVALAKNSGTQVEHAGERRQYFAPSLTWKPDAGTKLTTYLEWQHDRSGNTNAFLPIIGTLVDAPNGRIPSDLFIGEPAWDTYGGRRLRVGYELERELAPGWTLRHDLRHDRIAGKMRSLYANWWEVQEDGSGFGTSPLGSNRTLNRTFYATDNQARITNTDLLLEGKLDLGGTRHTLLLGVDAMNNRDSQADLDTALVDTAATPLDVYDPVYGSYPLPSLVFNPATVTRTRQWGLLLQDQVKFSNGVVLLAGLRRDHAQSSSNVSDTGIDAAAWSRNLGVVVPVGGGWSPYASYAESFEPVSGVNKRDDQPYKPKRGRQIEAGVKWNPTGQPLTVTAAFYKLRESNRLVEDPVVANNQIQLGLATAQGFELEGQANFRDWSLIGNYTYTDAKDQDAGHRLSGIPLHSAAVWAVHRFNAFGLTGMRAGLGVRFVGQTGDGAGVTTTPSNTITDALLSYDAGQVTYALNVSNLFDREYLATCLSRGDCWFGTRRKAVASVSYRF